MKSVTISLYMAALTGLAIVPATATAYEVANERQTYTAWKYQRGSTVTIPERVVYDLCGDWDGCTLRIGLYNWDGNGRTASRSSLFYYNRYNKTWRSERDDRQGTANNNVTEHAMHAWSCYFTDGEYQRWHNRGDFDLDFGLLSWDQYNADCKLTIID
jgi:hypothetical protein